jgi:hypothetical protein
MAGPSSVTGTASAGRIASSSSTAGTGTQAQTPQANPSTRAGEGQFSQLAPRRGLEQLPPETLANVTPRLKAASIAALMQTSRAMNVAVAPDMRAHKVTADAQVANTLPKLKQLFGQAPFRNSANWQPKHTLQTLSHAQRVRPLLVSAALVSKVRPASNRGAAQLLIRAEARNIGADPAHPLISDEQLDEAFRGSVWAAQDLVRRGASVPDAAELFAFQAEAHMVGSMYRSALEDATRDGPAADAVRQRRAPGDWRPAETVDQVMSRLGLHDYSRQTLERVSIATFGQEALNQTGSVDQAIKDLGLSDASRGALEAMLNP